MRFRVVTKTNVPEHSQENNYCRSSQDSNIYIEKKSSLNRVILQLSNKIPTRHLRLTNINFIVSNGLPLLKFCMIIFGSLGGWETNKRPPITGDPLWYPPELENKMLLLLTSHT